MSPWEQIFDENKKFENYFYQLSDRDVIARKYIELYGHIELKLVCSFRIYNKRLGKVRIFMLVYSGFYFF